MSTAIAVKPDLSAFSDEEIWQESSERKQRIARMTPEEYLAYYPEVATMREKAIQIIARNYPEAVPHNRLWIDPECGTTHFTLKLVGPWERNKTFDIWNDICDSVADLEEPERGTFSIECATPLPPNGKT